MISLINKLNGIHDNHYQVEFQKDDLTNFVQHNDLNLTNWEKLSDQDVIAFPSSFMRFPASSSIYHVHKHLNFVDEIDDYIRRGESHFVFTHIYYSCCTRLY